ncbi:SIMPL domain-containing protein [Qipengyuania sediminis]|uniref:SIMPL domain-containing protein n=1 Tax=Qipengyuania sediminis TaxID=1532023 RepID=UPI00105A96F4|nr:SIMPL domain-containing protein [Qipengyuania sediminis]
MIRLPLFAPFALAAIAAPAAAAQVQLAAQGPVVELAVTETVKARPDIATVSAGVTSRAPTAVAAMERNATAMEAVVARIRNLGIARDDVQTTGIELAAQYDYDQATRRQVFRGYQASNRVSVTLRKVPDTGRVLDALVAAGATDISGPAISIDDDTAPRAQARKAAIDKARAQAEEYARWAGFSGVRLLKVSEAVNPGRPMPYQMRTMDVAEAQAATPVEPGLVGTMVTVSVTYEMTR